MMDDFGDSLPDESEDELWQATYHLAPPARIDLLERRFVELRREVRHQMRQLRQIETSYLDILQRILADNKLLRADVERLARKLKARAVLISMSAAFGAGVAVYLVNFAHMPKP